MAELKEWEKSGILGTPMKTTRDRRYVTWRLPDRQFSRVHLLGESPDVTLCGRTPPRATGSPQPPIPEVSLCPACLENEA
jgi:hypothetical protein